MRRPKGRPSQETLDKLARVRRDLLDAVRRLDRWDPSAGTNLRDLNEARLVEFRSALRLLQNAEDPGVDCPTKPSEVSVEEARGLLDSDTLGLVFASGADRFHVLVLAEDHQLEILSLDADRRQIQTLVDEILEALDPRAVRENRLESRVQQLSRILLAPLAEKLGASQRLAIVAEAPLDKLPFEILAHPETGRRLIESHELAYLPSFSVLRALRERGRACTPPESELLAMGDPLFGSEDRRWPGDVDDVREREDVLAFQRLESTATEVAGIARSYPGAEPITGKAATRERFLAEAPRHRVIHVASHAWTDARIPEQSKIAFSCVDPQNVAAETCDLYFQDVLALELCGQTVVLSACRTAGGLTVEGEGVLGLPWAFLRAGASTVVASLWQVKDKATADLMSSFHHHLVGGMDPAGALRQARLALIESGQPPSSWAPFVLLGDWRIADTPSTFSAPPGPIQRLD
jgi:CHAT domain-containing protein